MKLPPLFVLDQIPVSREDTPSGNDLRRWSYLKDSGVTLGDQIEGEIGLILGSNASAVMEPLEVVPGQEGGPYAVRTRFGWVLGGAPKNSRNYPVSIMLS